MGKEGKNIFFVFICHMTSDESDTIFGRPPRVWLQLLTRFISTGLHDDQFAARRR